MKKAVVALSGGVDSSVAALLLKKQGFEVVGVTGKMIDSDTPEKAAMAADKLGIQLCVLDVRDLFKENVISYFKNSYISGKTPNPCIMCNQFIKWGVLFDYAIDKLNADIFATGHYADIRFTDGAYKIYPAKDSFKDQLYFLYRLSQKQLSKTVFPLSDYEKEQIKNIALKYDLPAKDSKESQDICFIEKPLTTKKYLIDNFGEKQGCFVDINTGKILGKHSGFYQYTIGQRKGIGISAPNPLYVVKIDAASNIVYLGEEKDNFRKKLVLYNLNLTYPVQKKEFEAWVKVRYNMDFKKANVKVFDNFIEIEFSEPVNSVTPGQSGVIYDLSDKHLIGGGIIDL